MPLEYFEWQIAFDTGWTLEYIGSLSYTDVFDYIQIKDAIVKARAP